jgi:hypothetical protein
MAHRTRVAALVLVAIALLSGCNAELVQRIAGHHGVELTAEQADAVARWHAQPRTVEQMIRARWAGTGHADRAVRIARCESKLNPRAQNSRSTAYGLFQFLNSTWRSTGIAKTSDPQLQVEAAFRLWQQRGWQPWVCRG